MPKTFKPTRIAGKRLPVSMRIGDDVLHLLDKAAKKSGRSRMTEIEYRLQRSFNDEAAIERVIGGPDVRRIAEIVISSFVSNGRVMAEAKQLPDPDKWKEDRDCFRSATLAVFGALMAMMPGAWEDAPTLNLEIENLKGRILTRLMTAGRMKIEEAENKVA